MDNHTLPTISVVMPTYNRAHLIERAVNSVLVQIGDGDELIIVDDGSTDDTSQVLSPYLDRLKYIQIENLSAGCARNRGIAEAKGELVAFIDSDDEWMRGKIETQRQLFASLPEILFCFSNFASTDIHGKVYRRHLRTWHNDPRSWDEILGEGKTVSSVISLPEGVEDFKYHVGDLSIPEMKSAYVFTSTVVARREEAGSALHFAEDIPTFEDLECFGRMALIGKAVYLDTETAWQHGEAHDRLSAARSFDRASSRLVVLERVWGQNKDFLERHGQEYRDTVDETRLWRIADLILMGRTGEARKELALVQRYPLSYKLLALLPGSAARGLLALRRVLRSGN